MKTLKFFLITMAAGAFLFSACSKETYEPDNKDAIIHITVLDEQEKPLAGIPVMIYDEKGYEEFKQNKPVSPAGATMTLPDGKVNYRLPYQKWFESGSRTVTFVVKLEEDSKDHRVWTISRTIKASEQVKIEFKLDKDPTLSEGTALDMYNENNGKTLFGNAIYIDAEGKFIGNNRYSFVDAGQLSDLNALGALNLEKLSGEIAVQPQHGYFVCKDISLMEFTSGKWGIAIASEFSKIYVTDWLKKDGKTVGASIRYVIQQPEKHGLPEWETVYNVTLKEGKSVTIPLPEKSNDSECATPQNNMLQFSFGSDHVTIQITDPEVKVGKQYRVYIRSGVYYTEIKLQATA